MMKSVINFLRSEKGGEGSQTAILIAVGSAVIIGLLTFAGTKIKEAVDAGGGTLDNAKNWEYGNGSLTK
ncbi:MAG: hypothetical protein H0Z39_07025 [Peptococcaceae bacterium]|nr:hypothetical protein [Peptococcaceae bacterium]